MGYAPKLLVDGPEVEPRAHTIVDAIDWRTDDPEQRAQNGIEWSDPVSGGGVRVIGEAEDCELPDMPKGFDGFGGGGESSPFTLYTASVCGPIGIDFEERQTTVKARLENLESRGITGAVFSANAVTEPSIDNVPVTPVTGSSDEVISQLDTAFAELNPGTGLLLVGTDILHEAQKMLDLGSGRTSQGHRFAIVPGLPPRTLVLIPRPIGYRSDVFVSARDAADLFDVSMNDLYTIAERTYTIGFDASKGVRATVPVKPEPGDANG